MPLSEILEIGTHYLNTQALNQLTGYPPKEQTCSAAIKPTTSPRSITYTAEEEIMELSQLESIFKIFHGEESLACFRDQVWNEGTITKDSRLAESTDQPSIMQLSLVSDPYSLVVIEPYVGPKPQVRLTTASSRLYITVTKTPKQAEVSVDELTPVYLASNANIAGEIKQFGLTGGLISLSIGKNKCVSGSARHLTTFNPEVFDSQEQFYGALADSYNFRKAHDLMPKDLRKWSDLLIRQFPPELRETQLMTSSQLLDWAYQIKKTPKLIRLMNKALPIQIGI